MKTNFRKEKDDDFDVSKSHTISKLKTEKSQHMREIPHSCMPDSVK